MLNAKKITDKIILISAPSQHELGSVFLRFQEHYESPVWRGKVFTAGQLRAWYCETYGQNSYERDWTGFNFPSSVLEPFRRGLFDPLTPAEQELLDLFKYRHDNFYIIGAQDQTAIMDHEICHGLFATVPAYKRAVMRVLVQNRTALKAVRAAVSKLMYHPAVVDDEVHAYTSVGTDDLDGLEFPRKVHLALRAIKARYLKV